MDLAPLLKSRLPLLKSAIKPLGMLGLTEAASGTDAAINKKILGSGATTLIISNDEMNDILKIVKSLEDPAILLKRVNETIKNESKEKKGGFLSMLLGTLGASLLGKNLSGKGVIKAGEGTIRAGYGSKRFSLKKVLIPTHPLTNFEIEVYYQNELRFNDVVSREKNLPDKIKDRSYVINLDEYSDIGRN